MQTIAEQLQHHAFKGEPWLRFDEISDDAYEFGR
jgi:hypothetical protein